MYRKSVKRYIHPGNRPLLLLIVFLLAINMGRAAEPFDYFQNSWSVIGLKDYNRGTRITPDNELLLSNQNKVQIRFGRQLTALSRKQTKTCLQSWLPVVLLSACDGTVRYDIKFWASPLPSVKDWEKTFNWPGETDNYLNWIYVTATNTGSTPTEAKLSVNQSNAPEAKPHQFAWTLPAAFEKIAPQAARYEHEETWHDDNGHSHVRASLLGPSLAVPIVDGQLTLGTWQQIILVDFDTRPRTRKIICQITGE